ncbi:mRNA binding protein puf3 [Paramarasmius palmivorus]|uniref:mRNA binding protein puf3 n=1 Tax=Paramarasmius palmivorus TaxID=297713 RepID=A0AAW0D948_9AGAR
MAAIMHTNYLDEGVSTLDLSMMNIHDSLPETPLVSAVEIGNAADFFTYDRGGILTRVPSPQPLREDDICLSAPARLIPLPELADCDDRWFEQDAFDVDDDASTESDSESVLFWLGDPQLPTHSYAAQVNSDVHPHRSTGQSFGHPTDHGEPSMPFAETCYTRVFPDHHDYAGMNTLTTHDESSFVSVPPGNSAATQLPHPPPAYYEPPYMYPQPFFHPAPIAYPVADEYLHQSEVVNVPSFASYSTPDNPTSTFDEARQTWPMPQQQPVLDPNLGNISNDVNLYMQQTQPSIGSRSTALYASTLSGEEDLWSDVFLAFERDQGRGWMLKDIRGHVVEFCGSQRGSRFIQCELDRSGLIGKQFVFNEIYPDSALQLIQDVFGNYVVQKLFEHGTQRQRALLASLVAKHIFALSTNYYGCRVVQAAIDFLLPDQRLLFLRKLEPFMLVCIRHPNANHVVQKLMETVPPNDLKFISRLQHSVLDLAVNFFGGRVLQKSLDSLPYMLNEPLLEAIRDNAARLMINRYGNYVVQLLLERGTPYDIQVIAENTFGSFVDLARHKYASNACEKLLLVADPATRRILVDEILTEYTGVPYQPLTAMMSNGYGNYVLQQAIQVADSDQRAVLVTRVRLQLPYLRQLDWMPPEELAAFRRHLFAGLLMKLLDL